MYPLPVLYEIHYLNNIVFGYTHILKPHLTVRGANARLINYIFKNKYLNISLLLIPYGCSLQTCHKTPNGTRVINILKRK